jgi:hypothetical protein
MEIDESSQSDIQFEVGGGTKEYYGLYPLNGARAKSMGAGNINLSNCRDVSESLEIFVILQIYKGNHFCVISNKDRLFLFRDEGVTRSTDSIVITIHLFIKTN